MNTVLSILGVILIALSIIILAAFGYIGLQFFLFFHWRSCKHCGHTMEYKRLKEDEDGDYYFFYCPKCTAWEKVPKEEFYRQCDNPIEENKL